MAKWPWVNRTFSFDFPVEKHPDVLERWRGAPARIGWMTAGLDHAILSASDGHGWSILQNVGHLVDLAYLPRQRIAQVMAGDERLIAADMSNRKTAAADHNSREIDALVAELHADREDLAAQLERLSDADWGRSGIHPRLNQRMRIVDLIHFDCEHDDYHIARIRALIRALT